MNTAILIETGPSMELGAPSKRLRAIREALRFAGPGAWTACHAEVRWVPAPALAATLSASRHVDLPGAARRLARSGVGRVVLIGDLYDPRAVLDAMRTLRGVDRTFVEVLTPAERGEVPAKAADQALVAYLETLRPHRERALATMARDGVQLGGIALAA